MYELSLMHNKKPSKLYCVVLLGDWIDCLKEIEFSHGYGIGGKDQRKSFLGMRLIIITGGD